MRECLVHGLGSKSAPNRSAACIVALQLNDAMTTESNIGQALLRLDSVGNIR